MIAIPATSPATVAPAPTFPPQRGFTLTEMAVVLLIVGLLIGGMIVPMATQQDIRHASETQKLITEVSEALYGYAASHQASDGRPYLPCPDSDGDGRENRNGNACVAPDGDLPWADLGLGRQDAWGNPLRYAVTDVFANNATGFGLLAAGTQRVCADLTCTVIIATAVPVVLYSRGKNAASEQTPGTTPPTFFQRPAATGYDDIVGWLPVTILVSRMIAAGRLP